MAKIAVKAVKLKNLSIGRKFFLIALVSLVPLGLSTALWFVEIGTRVAAVEREVQGLKLHAQLSRALEAVIGHRTAAMRERGGETNAKAALEAGGTKVAEALRAAQAHAATSAAAGVAGAASNLGSMGTGWDIVQRGVTNRTVDETFAEHSEFVTFSLLVAMGEIARAAGLNVDADPASYYLSRIAIERMPGLIARLSEAADMGRMLQVRGRLANKEADVREYEQLRALAVLAQADLDAIDADVKSLFKLDEGFRALLETPLKEFDKKTNGYLRNLESALAASKSGALGFAWVQDGAESVAAALNTYQRTQLALDARLAERAGEMTRNRNLLILMNLVLIGLAGLFAFILMRSVRVSLARALSVADKVAAGDLTHVIEARGNDETARLMHALRQMNQSLSGMVGEVRNAAESIGSEVGQLAAGNRDLSQRTEAQASAIEQTASSLEELTASVRQNMDSARQTQAIAAQATEATQRGTETASRVVGHMLSIQDSTKQVGEIVGLIDSIAFQTNILALNAAVEAARAGEQGRGFAVVAGEVRNLAKRCADSAREIKQLIQTSSTQVEEGVGLVEDVARDIAAINQRVGNVRELMSQVVTASSEQSDGIEQVNQTISALERATQQNAALVEEVLAATEMVSRQTSRLAGLVAVFRLAGTPGVGTSEAVAPDAASAGSALPPRAKAGAKSTTRETRVARPGKPALPSAKPARLR